MERKVVRLASPADTLRATTKPVIERIFPVLNSGVLLWLDCDNYSCAAQQRTVAATVTTNMLLAESIYIKTNALKKKKKRAVTEIGIHSSYFF